MTFNFTVNDRGAPAGKLADAELVFEDHCDLGGLKLQGFGIWERQSDRSLYVTYPARTYQVNGERRQFALLRPTKDSAKFQLDAQILVAWERYRDELAAAS